jgi:hypothetical protein
MLDFNIFNNVLFTILVIIMVIIIAMTPPESRTVTYLQLSLTFVALLVVKKSESKSPSSNQSEAFSLKQNFPGTSTPMAINQPIPSSAVLKDATYPPTKLEGVNIPGPDDEEYYDPVPLYDSYHQATTVPKNNVFGEDAFVAKMLHNGKQAGRSIQNRVEFGTHSLKPYFDDELKYNENKDWYESNPDLYL